MAIGYLCQSFLQQNSQSMQSKNDCTATPITVNPLQHLQLGLPGLWSLMWTEPVNRFFTLGDGLIVGPRDSSLRSFLHGMSIFYGVRSFCFYNYLSDIWYISLLLNIVFLIDWYLLFQLLQSRHDGVNTLTACPCQSTCLMGDNRMFINFASVM